LLAAQEEERRSLSRMLHDELGQRVTAIGLDLKAALRRRGDAAADPSLRRAVAETDGVLSSLHEIATRVRPSVLDDLGLEDAIESYVSEYEERTGVSVEMELRLPPEGVPGAVGENLYRILQEALSNVSTHAGTDKVSVTLVAVPGGLELSIEDAGRGFDTSALKTSSRLGILGIQERVELLGGRFELDTAPGRGTRIHIQLSLPDEETRPAAAAMHRRAPE
jgi:signal transduction histidine kinase